MKVLAIGVPSGLENGMFQIGKLCVSSLGVHGAGLADIGQYKKEHNMPVLQAQRYGELLTRRADQAVRMGMDREFMRSVLQAIHEESIRQQMAVLGE